MKRYVRLHYVQPNICLSVHDFIRSSYFHIVCSGFAVTWLAALTFSLEGGAKAYRTTSTNQQKVNTWSDIFVGNSIVSLQNFFSRVNVVFFFAFLKILKSLLYFQIRLVLLNERKPVFLSLTPKNVADIALLTSSFNCCVGFVPIVAQIVLIVTKPIWISNLTWSMKYIYIFFY